MIVQAKLTQLRNKKVLEISKKTKEIRDLLMEKGLELAKAKMETILQEEDYITVFDILGTLLEKIKEKCSYLCLNDKCPEDLRATLDTIIFASARLEIDEFHVFRQNIGLKYGDLYIQDATHNKGGLVNVNVAEKLRMKVPQDQVIISRLKQLCKDFNIDYVFPQEIQPMTNMIDAMNSGGGMNNNNMYNPNVNYNNYPGQSFFEENPYSQLNFNQQTQFTQQNQFNQQNQLNQQNQFNNQQNQFNNQQTFNNQQHQQNQFNDTQNNQINYSFNNQNQNQNQNFSQTQQYDNNLNKSQNVNDNNQKFSNTYSGNINQNINQSQNNNNNNSQNVKQNDNLDFPNAGGDDLFPKAPHN